jgi:hypothetical protein
VNRWPLIRRACVFLREASNSAFAGVARERRCLGAVHAVASPLYIGEMKLPRRRCRSARAQRHAYPTVLPAPREACSLSQVRQARDVSGSASAEHPNNGTSQNEES